MEKSIGEKIKDIRKKKRINLAEVGNMTGMDVSKLSRIENDHQAPTIEEVEIIASVLGVLSTDLIGEDKLLIQQTKSGDLVEKIKEAGKLYASEDRGEFAGSEVGKIIKREIPVSLIAGANINQDKFSIEGSIGKGQFAEIPWVSIFNKNITESATKGIYIVYLYTADMKGIYLSLNQGFTYFREKFAGRKAREELQNISKIIRSLVNIPENMENYNIDLKANNALGKGYMAGHIAGKYYDLENMPSNDRLILDLLELIDVYDEVNLQIGNRTVEQFYDYLVAEKEGLIVSENVVESTTQIFEEENQNDEFTKNDIPKEKQEPVIDKGGDRRYLRDPKEALKALKLAQFRCEVNDKHETFIAKVSGKPYMESHHLIPISKSNLFGYSTDVSANICSLCPSCHRAIHSAEDQVKRKILLKLYEDRKERLEKVGIYITFEQLLKFYDVE